MTSTGGSQESNLEIVPDTFCLATGFHYKFFCRCSLKPVWTYCGTLKLWLNPQLLF